MKHILFVDDDDEFAQTMMRALAASGYLVTRAHNGKEAMQLYAPTTHDLVITDLIMPEMEGVELIVKLRQMHPGTKIIAMSGGGRNEPEAYLSVARRLGACRLLAKPFPLAELMEAVSWVLSGGNRSSAGGSSGSVAAEG
ncbi:MAG: response regulator receiver [Limisphaerales bacterium]|nr:MAG: response regulator receiver [Limisphaerales bacterium]